MTTKINSDTSDGLKITSDTSGILDIQSAGTTKMTVGTTIDIQGNELVLDADADTSITVDTDDRIDFKIGGSDKVTLNNDSQLNAGTFASNGATMGCTLDGGNGNLFLSNTQAGSWANLKFHNPNGIVGSIDTSGSGTSYATSSDYRLKENVTYSFDATSRLKQLKPARFNFKADADITVDGFLAHEVSSIVPEAITGIHNEVQVWEEGEELPEGVSVGDNKLDDEGNTIPKYQGIDQSKLVPLLVKTIQELEARVTTLEG